MGVDAEMFVRTRAVLTDWDLRKMAGDLCAAFGAENFMLDKDGHWHDNTPRHALSFVPRNTNNQPIWEQDGPDIVGGPDETFIRVHLCTRYYGPGYERGDFLLIFGVACWLEAQFDDCAVYYGGDSGGICAAPFDAHARTQLLHHFTSVGHEPYRSYFGYGRRAKPVCVFCGDRPMHDVGGGGDREFWHCDGCDTKVITTPRGLYELKEKQDFFGWVEPAGGTE